MPIVKTKGAASSQGFGEFAQASSAANYIEDVFSTYLYTGNSATNSITNGIDLAGKGGLVWIKNRTFTTNNFLADTARGIGGVGGSTYYVASNTTSAQSSDTNLMSVGATGFTLLPNATSSTNGSYDYASWTFRKQPKFFDVVTYTGTGSVQNIAHNLGSVPGCIIVKRTSSVSSWTVYHRSTGNTSYTLLNLTNASATDSTIWNNTDPTSTQFTVGTAGAVNSSGGTFVAYIFAHNAGGFGLTGTDNVISCGSFTTDASGNATVNLGYEPQWILTKETGAVRNWIIRDNMRGLTVNQTIGSNAALFPNTSDAEDTGWNRYINPTSTGFNSASNYPSSTFIYIAIRRGPMKVPTSGTKVYNAVTLTGNNTARTITGVGFPSDLVISKGISATTSAAWVDRLRGATLDLASAANAAELSDPTGLTGLDNMDGFYLGTDGNGYFNYSGFTYVDWCMRRAPSFFDEVCYTGTGTGTSLISHNLGTKPLLVIVKSRSVGGVGYNWPAITDTSVSSSSTLFLNRSDSNNGGNSSGMFTSTTIDVGSTTGLASLYGDNQGGNASGVTYVAYLFATCAGVSKCTAFTGTGTLQTINCGFTSGARFVLIKRTDAAGDWYVWDSARGISSSTDPYLLLNSTAAEVTSTNWVDTTSTGFQVTAASGNNVNINGASYIALAIA